MIRALVAAVALALSAQGAAALSADRRVDEAALRKAKLELWPGFYRAQDAAGLAAFLADGFVAYQPDGSVETKAEAVDYVRRTPWPGANNGFRYDIRAITFLADDLANVYGVGSFADGRAAGQRRAYTSANLFRKQGGRWRPAFSHTSAPACRAMER